MSKEQPKDSFKMKAEVHIQESKHISLNFYMNYQQRNDLIDSIHEKQEVSIELLSAISELIRKGELSKVDYTQH